MILFQSFKKIFFNLVRNNFYYFNNSRIIYNTIKRLPGIDITWFSQWISRLPYNDMQYRNKIYFPFPLRFLKPPSMEFVISQSMVVLTVMRWRQIARTNEWLYFRRLDDDDDDEFMAIIISRSIPVCRHWCLSFRWVVLCRGETWAE